MSEEEFPTWGDVGRELARKAREYAPFIVTGWVIAALLCLALSAVL